MGRRQTEPETLSELPIWPADEPPAEPTPQPAIAMFSDKDESAVAGLLALGTSTTEMMAPDHSLSEFTISPPARERSLAQAVTPINFPDYSVTFSPGHLPQTAPLNPEMSPTETLELLRHYRYEVAPWVCLCRMKWKFIKTNIDSWIYVTSGKCLESRACSWQWSHNRFGQRCLLSRRHL